MGKTPLGVRQVNENIIQPGRALIITDEDFSQYDWNDLPNGTLHVDTQTGNISVKLSGETTWSPTGLKNDGTLVISRDTQFDDEVFKVTSTDNKDGTFTYENKKGQQRYKPVDKNGFVFELENGTYLMQRNHIEVTIDGVLTRTVMNGGIEEISERKIKVLDNLVEGQTVAIRYVKWVKIGNPYPRFFLNPEEPETPEIGDFWLDSNSSLDEDDLTKEISEDPIATVPWEKITGKPTTLTGYGIRTVYSLSGHTHRTLDITDFPTSLPANGGDSNTVKGKKPGLEAGDLVFLNGAGRINASMFPNNYIQETGAILIQDERPSNPKNKSLWICTDSTNDTPHIEVYSDYKWIKLGGGSGSSPASIESISNEKIQTTVIEE